MLFGGQYRQSARRPDHESHLWLPAPKVLPQIVQLGFFCSLLSTASRYWIVRLKTPNSCNNCAPTVTIRVSSEIPFNGASLSRWAPRYRPSRQGNDSGKGTYFVATELPRAGELGDFPETIKSELSPSVDALESTMAKARRKNVDFRHPRV